MRRPASVLLGVCLALGTACHVDGFMTVALSGAARLRGGTPTATPLATRPWRHLPVLCCFSPTHHCRTQSYYAHRSRESLCAQLEDGETAFFANGRSPRDPISMNAAELQSMGLAHDKELASAEYPDPFFFSATLAQSDPEIAAAVGNELFRQQDQLEMIASENIVSAANVIIFSVFPLMLPATYAH